MTVVVETGEAGGRRTLRKSAAKREAILDAAAQVFADKGYSGATMADIAARIGIHGGSLYYYFESREHLVREVLARAHLRTIEPTKAAIADMPAGTPALDRIATGLRTHVAILLSRDDYTLAYHRIIDQVPPAIREECLAIPRDYGRFWGELLDEARGEGAIRAELDLGLVRLLMFGSVIWSTAWYRRDGRSTPAEIADQLISLIFDGMRSA